MQEQGSVHAKELMQKLSASEITIRRDLTVLEEKGLLSRTHGGAMLPELAKDPDILSFVGKASQKHEQKIYLAELAAKTIKDGDIIFLDCGSTIAELCGFLKDKKIKIITNSLPVVYKLLGTKPSVTLIGGELDHTRQAIHGRQALKQMAMYQTQKAFIGADALSLQKGLSSISEVEQEHSFCIANNTDQVMLCIDSTKFEKYSFIPLLPLDRIHSIFTDQLIDPVIYKKYKQAGINLIK